MTRTQATKPSALLSAIQLCLFLLLASALLSGCLTARKMDKWVDSHYAGRPTAKAKDQPHFTVVAPPTNSADPASKTERLKGSFLPLLFYWQWNLTMHTELNAQIGYSDLRAALLAQANAKSVKEALGGGSLELQIRQVPHSFGLRDKGFMVFVLLAYFGSERVWFEPGMEELQVSYRWHKDGAADKNGMIRMANPDKPIMHKQFQSLKKLTGRYLENHDAQVRALGKEVVARIVQELATAKAAQP